MTGPLNSNYFIDSITPLTCSDDYYYFNGECVSECPIGTIPNYGSTTNMSGIKSGYCNTLCNNPATPFKCQNKSTYSVNYKNGFKCISGYFACDLNCCPNNEVDTGALNYSSRFMPNKITIPIESMQNYYLEFYYFADKVFFPPTNTATSYYIWYTSGLRVARDNNFSNESAYTIYDSNSSKAITTGISTILKYTYGQWHKISYLVSVSGNTYTITYYNKNSGNLQMITNSTMSLKAIQFINNINGDYGGGIINWFTGYYKNLAIYDTSLLDLSTNEFVYN